MASQGGAAARVRASVAATKAERTGRLRYMAGLEPGEWEPEATGALNEEEPLWLLALLEAAVDADAADVTCVARWTRSRGGQRELK